MMLPNEGFQKGAVDIDFGDIEWCADTISVDYPFEVPDELRKKLEGLVPKEVLGPGGEEWVYEAIDEFLGHTP